MLAGFWMPQDFDLGLNRYVHDGDVVSLVHDVAR
jgi:hypothetical protein